MSFVLRNGTRSGTKWGAKRKRFFKTVSERKAKRQRFFKNRCGTETKRQRFLKTSNGNGNASKKAFRNEERNGNAQNRCFHNPACHSKRLTFSGFYHIGQVRKNNSYILCPFRCPQATNPCAARATLNGQRSTLFTTLTIDIIANQPKQP